MCFDLVFAGATHIREQAKIDAARITQKSGNALRGSQTALQQFSAALGNKRRMDAAGNQVNDMAGNSARLQRSLTHTTMQGRIQAAEELGAVAAQAGAAGVGGTSVETYNETVRLQSAIKEAAITRAAGQQEWAAGEQRGNAVKAAVAGLDNNNYRANLDYTQYVDHKKPSFLERAIGIAGSIGATVFAGPQAGAAVAGIFEGHAAALNGDFAGASQSFSGAIQNGLGAARTKHLLGVDKSGGGPGVTAASEFEDAKIDILAGTGTTRSPFAVGGIWGQSPNLGSIIIK